MPRNGLPVNSLAPGKFERKLRHIIFKQISVIDGWGISCEIALIWMSLDFIDDQSTLVQVMAWCRQATSHYLSQCWPRFLLTYGVTRPQWVLNNKLIELRYGRFLPTLTVKHGIWLLLIFYAPKSEIQLHILSVYYDFTHYPIMIFLIPQSVKWLYTLSFKFWWPWMAFRVFAYAYSKPGLSKSFLNQNRSCLLYSISLYPWPINGPKYFIGFSEAHVPILIYKTLIVLTFSWICFSYLGGDIQLQRNSIL